LIDQNRATGIRVELGTPTDKSDNHGKSS
jgi:hypothetical protein